MKYLVWLAALAACGHSSPATPDPDAAADAPPIGPTGPVTVYAPYHSQAANAPPATPGATVLFYAPSGELLDRKVTDSTGSVTGMVPAHATIAVVPPPTGDAGGYFAWVDVAPGDHLYADHPADFIPGTTQSNTVTIPRDGDDVTEYEVEGAGYFAQNLMPPATGNITLAGTYFTNQSPFADLVGIAKHSDHHDRFFVAPDVHLEAAAIDLSSGVWKDAVPVDIPILGIASDTQWLSAYDMMLAGDAVIWQGSALQSHPGATFDAQFETPGMLGDGHDVLLMFQRGTTTGNNATFWAGSFHLPTDNIDLAALTVEATNVTTTASGVTWDADGTNLALAQGAYALVFTDVGAWNVILPPDARSFTLPALPPDLPSSAATKAHVTFVTSNEPGGYPALRTDGWAMNLYTYGQQMPAQGYFRLAGY